MLMFGLFKKKSPEDQLREQYQLLMKEAFELSTVNRAASDQKYAAAEAVMAQLEALQKTASAS
jgi:hypothetical protein